MKRIAMLLPMLLLSLVPVLAGAQAPNDPLASVRFLLGDWKGTGNSDAGAGAGTSTFTSAVGGTVIVRRDATSYPAQSGHEAVDYQSMMVIYKDVDGIRGDYWDNGGHVIHYTLAPGSPSGVAQFVSNGAPNAPSFRLTYTKGSAGLRVLFELEAPGAATYRTVADGMLTP